MWPCSMVWNIQIGMHVVSGYRLGALHWRTPVGISSLCLRLRRFTGKGNRTVESPFLARHGSTHLHQHHSDTHSLHWSGAQGFISKSLKKAVGDTVSTTKTTR